MIDLVGLTNKAKFFAIQAHGLQKYGEHPYSYHLDKVVEVMKRYHKDPILLTACWLHDILEDTLTTYQELVDNFGLPVAELVLAVSDGKGKNRKERKKEVYHKLKSNSQACLIKLADRIANIESALMENKTSLFLMYQQEQPEFEKSLRTLGTDQMWQDLKDLLSREGGIFKE